MRQESTTTREGKDPQDDRSANYAVHDGDSTNDYSSHVKTLEVTEMKICRWAGGHTLRDHVRNDDVRERVNVENITERYRKARLVGLDTSRGENKNTSDERLWRLYHLGEESEEDRSRGGWTVLTGT